jgi:hypothetical protein
MASRPVHIQSKPGIKRDGTIFEGDFYVDGQWVRFQRGLPRKMWGYRQVINSLGGASRGMYSYPYNGLLYTFSGSSGLFEMVTVDSEGFGSAPYDRTPAGFTDDPANLWSIDALYDTATTATAIFAHPAPNLLDISSSENTDIYTGDITATTALTVLSGAPQVSGGILALHPYLIAFGNNGYVAWSAPGDPTNWASGGSGEAWVTAQKIVAGINTRGGAGNSPSAILWSLDSVIRMSFTGTVGAEFSFDTISDESSILSQQSVIEYDGVYYWCGTDRFLSYNGVVREVPNNLNLNWFFDNLNYAQRQKVFATKVPRWGEIWWCFPFGDATECSHAIIYNIREGTWYDTVLPNTGRTNGQYPRVFQYPLMIGSTTINSIRTLGTKTAGTSYTNGTYYNVQTINQTSINGSGATFNVTVSGNVVSSVTLVSGGHGYAVGDEITVSNTLIGGTGSGFKIKVATLCGYTLWQHEYGVDELTGQTANPIESYFETSDISLAAAEQSQNRSLRVTLIEPDFVQSGPMTVTVNGRSNARAKEVSSESMEFPDTPTVPQEQVVFFKEIRREMRFLFRSNVLGGDYQMGMCLAHIEPADGTLLGAVE